MLEFKTSLYSPTGHGNVESAYIIHVVAVFYCPSVLANCLTKFTFFSVLLNVADGRPATRYLVAVDGGQMTTLEEIVKVCFHSTSSKQLCQSYLYSAVLSVCLSVKSNLLRNKTHMTYLS